MYPKGDFGSICIVVHDFLESGNVGIVICSDTEVIPLDQSKSLGGDDYRAYYYGHSNYGCDR